MGPRGFTAPRLPTPSAQFVVLAVLVAVALSAVWRTWGIDRSSLRGLIEVAVLLGAAWIAMRLARSLRGRASLADALHPLVWIGPWHFAPLSATSLALSFGSSLLWIGWTCGWRALLERIREDLGRVASSSGQALLGSGLLVVVIWLAHMTLPAQIVDEGLDVSWSRALQVALLQGLQHGPEIVFTMGPLGGLATGSYDPHLLWVKLLLFEGAFKLLMAVLLVLAGLRIRGPLERVLYFLILIALPLYRDSVYLLAALAAASLLLDRPGRSRLLLLSCTAVLAVLSLIKFTALPVCVASVVVIGLAWRKEVSKRAGWAVPACYAAWVLALWMLCRQSPWNLPLYVARALQVSTGYVEGQSMPAAAPLLSYGLVLVGLLGILALLHMVPWPRRPAHAAMAAVLAGASFVAFKLGFVRGSDHTPIFFGLAACAAQLLAVPGEPRTLLRLRSGLRVGCSFLGTLALLHSQQIDVSALPRSLVSGVGRVTRNATTLRDPSAWREARERETARTGQRLALPETRRIVGSERIDMISYEQGLLFQNDLTWSPRPVFQSYITFTPDLLAANARYLESEHAPPFVLVRLQTIDQRMLTMDDGLALQVLARDYEPVLQEKDYVLMRRARRSEPVRDLPVVLERTVAFGESVDLSELSDECLVLSLDFARNLRGALYTFLYLAPPIFMTVQDEGGRTARVRIVPGMMRTGAILSPWITSQEHWLGWFTGASLPRIVSIEIESPADEWMYEPAIGLRVSSGQAPVPVPSEAILRRPYAGIFSRAPDHLDLSHPPARMSTDGVEVLMVHAPSVLRFDLAPGDHRIEGGFGMLPSSYVGGRETDGATFDIVVKEAGQPERVLLQRLLEPASHRADRGTQAFQASFRTQAPAALLLVTGNGPRDDTASDWTYWSAVRID